MFYSIILANVICFAAFNCKAQISTFPYVEDFETAPSWTASTAPTSSLPATSDWAWGTPNHTYVIHGAGSGNKCWCAGGLTGAFYNNWEQSYVKSPVFNFTSLLYPHIKFKLFYDCEYHFDGGNLQYSLNGGTTWNDVGTVGGTTSNPIPETTDCNTKNWYNYPGINYLNSPAGFVTSKHGWCGNTQAGGTGWDPASPSTGCVGGNGPGQWITAEHCLTGCAGQANVTFRFTFASGFTCNNFDGFAFDSVSISNGVPNIANFTSVCGPGTTINFTSTFASCPQTNAWLWNFGDPASASTNTINTQNASHTFSTPGTYTVVLIAKGGACNPPDTITKVVQVMGTPAITSTNVFCFGGNNGAATATIAPLSLPLTYAWSPSGGLTTSASNLTAGNYTFTATDAAGCQKTAAVIITQPPVIVASVVPTDVSCADLANGSATLAASGGVGPLTYSWSPLGGSALRASGLNAGNYTTTVTDQNLCTKTATFSITQPTAINASITVSNAFCGNPGSATVTATGGTGNLLYVWSPGGGTNTTANGLSSGNYWVTLTDANSCNYTAYTTITQTGGFSTAITSTNVSCFGGNTGSLQAVITGSTSPYSYTWSPEGGHSATATGLPADTYSLSVSDINGCINTATASVTQPPGLNAAVPGTTVCNGQQATLTASVAGGTAPYTYMWLPAGSTGSSITTTPAVTTIYTLTVTDNNNCISAPIISSVIIPPAVTIQVTGPFTLCSGVAATLTAMAAGGNGNYQYVWLPGNLPGAQINPAVTANTQYTATVTDGCTTAQAATQVNILADPAIHIQSSGITGCPTLCSSFYDSTLISSGNIASWSWVFSNGQASTGSKPYICFTKPGNYTATLTVVTSNGCRVTPAVSANIVVYNVPTPDFTCSTFDGDLSESPFILTNTSLNYTGIQWQTTLGTYTDNPVSLNYETEGVYPVKLIAVNSFGCKDSITKYIKVEPLYTFYAPNTFTPNNDKLNEAFIPVGEGWNNDTYKLYIFDRWGELIYHSADVAKGWDGKTKGGSGLAEQDVYVWKVELDDVFRKHHSYIGHIAVLR